eukprot:8407526-Pyramimonas_sp.AAC.1
MFSIRERSVSASSLVQLRTWIDEVTQRAEGTRRDVVGHPVRAGVTFARGCAQECLKLASKSTIIASDLAVAREIQAGLGAHGVVVEVASVAADLGVERGSGAKN